MQHSFFLWWVTISVLIIFGAVAGILCAQSAYHYGRLLRAGCPPDGYSLWRAVFAACSHSACPIIRVGDAGRPALLSVVAASALIVMLTGLYLRFGVVPWFILLALVSVVLVLLACIDLRTCLLPDALTQPLLWFGIGAAWADVGINVTASIAGVMLGFALLAVPRFVWLWWQGVDGMGRGDIKFLAAVGAWVGEQGVMIVLAIACFTSLIFAMMHQRRWRPAGAYPFGPFIAAGGLTQLLFPSGVQSWF